MHLSHLFLTFVVTLLPICYADDFVPRVTKVNEGKSFTYNMQAFDDSETLIKSSESKVSISDDNGKTWRTVKDVKANYAFIDPFHSHNRAFALSPGAIHITNDMGKTWNPSKLDIANAKDGMGSCEIKTHPNSEDYLIAECWRCEENDADGKDSESDTDDDSEGEAAGPPGNISCRSSSFISKDGGKNFQEISHMEKGETGCEFGVFSTKSTLVSDETVFCFAKLEEIDNKGRVTAAESKLSYTQDFGKSFQEFEQFKDMMIGTIKVLDSYLLVFTQEDRFNRQSNSLVWVSTDGKSFEKAYLPTQLRNLPFSKISEGSMGKIFLPVMVGDKSNGWSSQVLISDSRGLKFSAIPWTEENNEGLLLVEESEYLKGSIIAEFGGVRRSGLGRKKKKQRKEISKISTDGGYTWSNLKVVDPENKKDYPCDIDDVENCSLHTQIVYGRESAVSPGILLRMGVVGDGFRVDREDATMFLSRDGGQTWKKTKEYDSPSLFAFGDMGNIIVACPFDPEEDGDPQSEFYYSLDQGETWKEYQLEQAFFPAELVSTTPDGSGLNFILKGYDMGTGLGFSYAIDFNEAFDGKKCEDSDFEPFYVANGECVNGVKLMYKRRKSNAPCLIRKPFENLEPVEEVCEECLARDYECSFEFSRNADGLCELDYKLLRLSDACKDTSQTKTQLKPMQLLRGDRCQRELDIQPVEIYCKQLTEPQQNSGGVSVRENEFDSNIVFYQYFDTMADETIIFGTIKNDIYISHDSGQTIKKFDMDDKIIEVVFNPYFNSSAYFFGMSGTLYVTKDRGKSFRETKLPEARQLGFPLEFHAKDENTFIYYGGKDCDSMFSPECHAVAYITTDGGKSFKELLNDAIHCEFIGSQLEFPYNDNQVFCQVKEKHSQTRALVSSNDYFASDKSVLYESIIGYMSTGDFIVVAVPLEDGELRAYVTVDGHEFAEAKFPVDATAEKQEAFTVLGSQTGSIFLHLSTSNKKGGEYGVLMKSNSNGTSFVTLEKAVNRNQLGMVDFEKVQGLEGIILVNTVVNHADVIEKGAQKELKSRITFNDGSDWSYIEPPKKDSEGKKFSCSGKPLPACSLHLHSYSERVDVRDTFSSGSALGMLFGVGNVGSHLLPEDECSTFFSSDGGESWKEIKKGAYQWEFGDHGGVLVLVPKYVATNTLTYSVDSGASWRDFEFTDEKAIIQDIVTVPGDSVMRFLLLSQSTSVRGGSTKTFSIDFTGIFKNQCVFNREDPSNDDFDYLPLGNFGSKCLFGHQAKYLRKTNNDCYVGNVPLSDYTEIISNCSCTREDYECDYNYQKSKDGTCKLVEGLSPIDPSDACKKSNAIEYFKPSGYRKIPLSTCQGGLKLDAVSDPLPCPGKEAEYNEKYKLKGSSFLAFFFIPFLIFALLAWFVYERGIRRNGGFARFGEIRLGDDTLIENNGTDRAVNTIIKSGLYAVSGLYAGYQLVKRSLANAVAKVSERFGRRRGPTYSSLLHDQFLDDADDLLEGHDDDASDLGSFLENEGNFEIEEERPYGASTQEAYSDEVQPAAEVGADHRDDEEDLN